MTIAVQADRSLEHLLARLASIEQRARAIAEGRHAADPDPADRFRGLYLSIDRLQAVLDERSPPPRDEPVESEIDRIDGIHGAWTAGADDLRLRRLADTFDLDLIDTEILLVALAPDLDGRFEALYGYLNDDVTRRRATVRLALALCGQATTDAAARASLSDRGQLVRLGLLVIDDRDRPALSRALRVPDRVTSFLLGDDAHDPQLADLIDPTLTPANVARWPALSAAIEDGLRLIYLRESGDASGLTTAVSSAQAVGAPALVIDLQRLARVADARGAALVALREARLGRSILIAGPVDALVDTAPDVIRVLADSRWPVILVGGSGWDPGWSRSVPLLLDAPRPNRDARRSLWLAALEGRSMDLADDTLDDLSAIVPAFKLAAPQLARAAQSARVAAQAERRPIHADDLRAGARAQSAAGLDRLARRVAAQADWADMILPSQILGHLRELAARARLRDRVLDDWSLGGATTRGRGITALFAGESGTGKTLAAEVIATELGLDMYVIDLSSVVDKYIGETEKNLDRIFNEAEHVNGVLLFDEADAIFGKRSEVRDARDRYANVEVAYLLQRMERFDGLAVLTTNLRANIDEAFTRRIDVIVDFPMPDDTAREELWRMHLPGTVPQDADIDFGFLARSFRISGGNVRNICLTAAFLAADEDSNVGMTHLIRGVEREYRKLGRLTPETEFGPYHTLVGR
jgi:hypothetical protein